MFRIRLSLVPLMLCAVLFCGVPASAAGLSEDHTVLYYLIEMQRRVKKTCGGNVMPEAPSLMPSEALRAEARKSVEGVSPRIRADAVPGGVPAVYLTGRGKTPQQVFDSLAAGQCRTLMGPDYHYIGAAGNNGTWTVILSGAPALSSPSAEVPAPSPVAAQPPPPPAGAAARAGEKDPGPSRIKITPEEREPAAPVPVGRIHTDAAGRPVGSVEYYSSTRPVPQPGPDYASPPAVQPPSAPDAALGDAGAGASFVPPTEPGPFGVRRSPSGDIQALPARPGVTPLRDSRPPPAEDPLVYVAPGRTPSWPQDDAPPTGDADAPRTAAASESHTGEGSAGLEAAKLLGLVNAARAGGRRCGASVMPPAPALSENFVLKAAAEKHAADMTAGRFFSSTTPEGVTLGQRLTAAGYVWSFVAEDIAHMDGTADDVLRSWLAVENRCFNLMGSEYIEAGAGYDPAGRNWVFTLATPMQ
jgi:uncharacterized protein YkwD